MKEYSHTNLGTVIRASGDKTSLVDVLNEFSERIKQLEALTNPAGSQQNAPTSK